MKKVIIAAAIVLTTGVISITTKGTTTSHEKQVTATADEKQVTATAD